MDKNYWELRLYIAGQTPKSVAALANLKKYCVQHLQGRYKLEVIDLLINPQLAEGDQILAIPTLVRKVPVPIRKIIGLSADNPGTLEGFRQQITEWRASGAAGGPRAEEKFQTLMGKYLDMVPNLPYADRSELLFQLQVERLKSGPDAQQALYKKEQGLRRDINELENDIATLQTNLEFFARSKNANQLREEYQGRIDEAKVRIDALKKQLKIVRS